MAGAVAVALAVSGGALVAAAELGEESSEVTAGPAPSEGRYDGRTTSRASRRTPLPSTMDARSLQRRQTPEDTRDHTDSPGPSAAGGRPTDQQSSPRADDLTNRLPDATPELGMSTSPGPASLSPTSPETGAQDSSAPTGTSSDDTGTPTATSDGDDTPPQTWIPVGPTTGDPSTFVFRANEPASFSCSLDRQAFVPCASEQQYTDLDPGWHTLAVRATDTAGNTDPSPAAWRWLVTGSGEVQTTP